MGVIMEKKILIVDDSDLHHKIYEIALNGIKDVKLIHCYNGMEAMKTLADNLDTKLIILDINMPVMTGTEFLNIFRDKSIFRNVHVLVVSSENNQEEIKNWLRNGAKDYLIKPFKPQDLKDKVHKLFAV